MDFKYPITIYSYEIEPGRYIYKGQFGLYNDTPAFIPVNFKKNVLVPNGTKIYIIKSWFNFYENKNTKKIEDVIFIDEFIFESEKSKKTNKEIKIEMDESKRTEIVSRLESKITILKKSNKNM